MHGRKVITLSALNGLDDEGFAAALEGVFEHAPWVAREAARRRPFETVAGLHDGLMSVVRGATNEQIGALLLAHPELEADRLPAGLTEASQSEQAGLGMREAAGASELPGLNQAYRGRFGFPFIVCVARHTGENVLRTLRERLGRSHLEEWDAALDEVGRITRLRLLARVDGPGPPSVAGHLSLHVLDLERGRAAADVAVTLRQEGRTMSTGRTDPDGRLAGLMPPGPLRQGHYELAFDAGGYFGAAGVATFYDIIPIRFRVSVAEGRYHVPLLLAPFGYSTYRGS